MISTCTGSGLYIHVPFCVKKCPYCNFYSVNYNIKAAELYTDAVIRNLNRYKELAVIDTIYFGGGTPSLLPIKYIKKILESVYNNFKVINPEITIEVNPKTVDKEKFISYKSAGINRVSVGVQSCIDSELMALGRIHSFNDAKNTILNAYKAGFNNVSCDLMLGITGQTIKSLDYSIKQFCELPISHVSAYMLKVESNTPFNSHEIIKSLPDEDLVSDMYLYLIDTLEKDGFKQYEISNFAKIGMESQHNLKYWLCKEYIGIGPSAHSFFYGKRFAVPDNLSEFIDADIQNEIVTENNPGDFVEKAMLKLRLTDGICLNDYKCDYQKIIDKARNFERAGLLRINNNTVSLTAKGFLVSNYIIAELIL